MFYYLYLIQIIKITDLYKYERRRQQLRRPVRKLPRIQSVPRSASDVNRRQDI